MSEIGTSSVWGRSRFYLLAARVLQRFTGSNSEEHLARLANPRSPSHQAVERALALLAERAPRRARIVELHLLRDVRMEELASILNLDQAEVRLHWRLGRAWLNRQLNRDFESE